MDTEELIQDICRQDSLGKCSVIDVKRRKGYINRYQENVIFDDIRAYEEVGILKLFRDPKDKRGFIVFHCDVLRSKISRMDPIQLNTAHKKIKAWAKRTDSELLEFFQAIEKEMFR